MRAGLAGLLLLAGLVGPPFLPAQAGKPIIDAHLHAFTGGWVPGPDTSWFPPALERVTSTEALIRQTVELQRRHHIVRAVASAFSLEDVELYRQAAPDRIVPALMLTSRVDLDSVRAWHATGRLAVLGEAMWQYEGLAPDDPTLEPVWKLAEELDLPVAIHMGLGPPGIQNRMAYRMRLSDPLSLEEVLVRHPRARVQVMHAGWPLLDRMVALLHQYPGVYVDVGVLDWFIPRAEFQAYLRRLIEAGFADRIMFGTDAMQWPSSIPIAVEAIESAEFLSAAQKRDILCNNAARFFRLDATLCGD